MKKILVPTDFSEHAGYAMNLAAQIAKKHQGEVILLHMLELPHQVSDAITGGHDIPEIMFFKNAALKKLDALMNLPMFDDIDVSQVIQFEMAFDGIMKLINKNHVDLIVMGSHGASGFQEMFIGSNAEKVVRNSEVPVLVVKKDHTDFEIKNFVFASDFSKEAHKPFMKATEIAKNFGAHLHLLYVNTPNNFRSTLVANEIIDDFLSHYKDLTNYSVHTFNDANIEKGILNFARSANADLIGIGTHGKKGIAHFFNGSTSEDIVNHAYRPVMTFKI